MKIKLLWLLMACLSGAAWGQTSLKVKMFPGAQALPAMAAASQGIFERHGLKVEVLFTANSQEQRDGLAAGEFQIAQAAVDNAVAMVELARQDVVIVTGGDSSMTKANAETLERYIAGLIEGTRWAVDPANREAAQKILAERLKVSPEVAARTWEILSDPKRGLATDGRFDMQGFRNVLALRAEIEGSWGGKPPPPERYVDLAYYDKALKRVSR